MNIQELAHAAYEGRPYIEQRVELSGHFRIEKGRRDPETGEKVVNGSWAFDNIITDQGLDYIGTDGTAYLLYCHVGTDTTPEATTDTALGAFVASTGAEGDVGKTYRNVQSSAPYYSTYHLKYEFGEGAAAGNISEIGIGKQNTTGGLFSRALVKDGASPLGTTTITVLSDEFLDVFYELRMYPDHVGSPHGSGTIPIDNASPRTTTTYEIAAAYVTTYEHMSGVGGVVGSKIITFGLGITYGPSATLGAVTGAPSAADSDGITTGGSSTAAASYTPGTYYRDVTWTVGLADGNCTGSPLGFDAILVYTMLGSYQIKFGTLFSKDATKIFTFTLRLAWARKTV